jgi:hypothetical protein
MGFVKIDHDIGTQVAEQFGPELTRIAAEEYAGRVKAKAAARFPRLEKHIHVEVLPHNQDHRVMMSVDGQPHRGKDGIVDGTVPDVAVALEFGFINSRTHRHVEGAHAFHASKKGLI